MSRSNPYKKKRREAKRTLLLYCEGADEKAFLSYLKMLFAENSGVAVTIKENHGGGANDVLRNVLRQNQADKVFCIYDADTGVDIYQKQKVENQGIECIENKPCLEAFLLNILENKDYSNHQKCDKCKKEFETKYLNEKQRKNKNNYAKVFPKELLVRQSKKIKHLKQLIDAINGKS